MILYPILYLIQYHSDWGRTQIRRWTHNRHQITSPHGRAVGWLLCEFGRRLPRYNDIALYFIHSTQQTEDSTTTGTTTDTTTDTSTMTTSESSYGRNRRSSSISTTSETSPDTDTDGKYAQKRKGRQGDCPSHHWRLWSLPSHYNDLIMNAMVFHQPYDCLLNRLFRRRPKKTSKLHVTGLCAGNSPVNGEFPAQMANNAASVSISWRHHERFQWRSGQSSWQPILFSDSETAMKRPLNHMVDQGNRQGE